VVTTPPPGKGDGNGGKPGERLADGVRERVFRAVKLCVAQRRAHRAASKRRGTRTHTRAARACAPVIKAT